MKRRMVLAMIVLVLLSFAAVAYAGWGACRTCYCPQYNDRGDLICECGHGYGSHGVQRGERYPLRPRAY